MSLSFFTVPIVFQLIVSMLSKLIPGIPNDACPFPGSTRKLHILCLLLCSTFTLHIPNCVIVLQLYILSLMFVSFVAVNCSTVALGNNFCTCKMALYFHHCPCQPYKAV